METITFETDIKVMYVTAQSFPEGVLEAHQKLHAVVPYSTERKYFGISRPENGVISYKAAAEELSQGEAARFNIDTLLLKKGQYICQTIHDYMKDIPSIGHVFQELLAHPELDPEGYCVEWYLNDKDVKCLVRLRDHKPVPAE